YDTRPSVTSRATSSGSRSSGSPQPPPPVVTTRTTCPARTGSPSTRPPRSRAAPSRSTATQNGLPAAPPLTPQQPSPPRSAGAVGAAEPPGVGGEDGAALPQRAVVLRVPEAAPPLSGAAGIRAQRELLDQERKPRLGELGRLIARVRHDVNGVASVGIVST